VRRAPETAGPNQPPGGWTATLLLAGLGEEIDQEKSQNTHSDCQHDQRKQTDIVFQKFSEHFHFLPPGTSRRSVQAANRIFFSLLPKSELRRYLTANPLALPLCVLTQVKSMHFSP
jgi:hypothetical protein